MLSSFGALNEIQQKTLLSSSLLSEAQQRQCASLSELVSSGASYTAQQLQAIDGISAETLANWGLTSSTDALSISELAEKAASDNQAKATLTNIVQQNAQTAAADNAAVSNTALAASEGGATIATGAFTTAIQANIKAMIAWLTSSPLGILTLIAGGVFLTVKAFDALTVSVSEQRERMESAVTAYQDAQTELSNINSELDAQIKRIDELRSKENLTYAEKGELEKLQQITSELRLQKKLAEKKEMEAQKEAASEAAKLFQKQYGNYNLSEESVEEHQEQIEEESKANNGRIIYHTDDLPKTLAYYKDQKSKYKQALKEGDTYGIKKYSKKAEDAESNLWASLENLTEQISAMSDYYNSIKDTKEADLSPDDKIIKTQYETATANWDYLYQELDPNEYKSMQIDKVFHTEGIEKTKEELTALAQESLLKEEDLSAFPNLLETLEKYHISAKELCEEINASAKEEIRVLDLNAKTPLSYSDRLSKTQEQSESFDLIGPVYTDVLDQGTFDWNSILNNEAFHSVFSGFTSEYETFIQTISNAPDDMAACQDAFDRLATSYLYGSDTLAHLNEQTKDATIAILEQKGITNAQELVTTRLAAEEAFLAEQKKNASIHSRNLTEASWQEMSAVLASGNVSGSAASHLEQLALSKIDLTNHPIKTDADVNAIIAIANATGVASSYVRDLSAALIRLQNANIYLEKAQNATYVFGAAKDVYVSMAKKRQEKANEEAEQLMADLKNGTVKSNQNPSDYLVNYSNAPKSEESSTPAQGENRSSGNLPNTPKEFAQETEMEFEEVFDWIENRTQRLKQKFDQWLKQAQTALTSKFITNYYRKATNSMKKELNAYRTSYKTYKGEADAAGLEGSYAKKVRNGAMEIERITDKALADRIKAYKDSYSKANDAMTSFLETAEKLYQLPLEKAASKIEAFRDALSLLDKQLGNAVGADAKNSFVDSKTTQERKTLNAQKKAKQETKKNRKEAGKKLTSANTLKNSGVSKKERKKIKEAVKEGKEVNLSYFKEGSSGYFAAVAYNEALKAEAQANYDFAAAKEDYQSWLREAAKLKFDNISDEYEKRIQMISYETASLDNQIAELEAMGKKVGLSYYKSKQVLNEKKLAEYRAQKKALEENLSNIQQGTDEWYDAYDQIQKVNNAISNCTKESYELGNAINKLHFDLFEDISSATDRIITEQEFLQGLLSHEKMTDDDTGMLTEAGLAKLGSLSASYYASDNKSKRIAAELNELQKMLENKNLHSDLLGITFQSADDLEKKIKELYDKWRASIKETHSFAADISELMKDVFQSELDKLKELINARKEALNAEKDLHDYQRTIQQKTENISTLQKQIAAFSGDTSEEGRARLQKLQKELSDSQDDLRETEYDRYLSDQQELMDHLYEEYEELLKKKLDDFYTLLENGLELSNNNTAAISDFLSDIAEKNGYLPETKELFCGLEKSLQDNIDRIIFNIAEQKEQQPIEKDGAGSRPTGLMPFKTLPSRGFVEEDARGGTVLEPVKAKQSKANLIPAEQVPGYKTIQAVSPRADNLIRMSALLAQQSSPVPVANAASNITATYNFTLENCSNADDIVHQIQQSEKVQKALRSVTSDRMAGSGRLSVLNIQ